MQAKILIIVLLGLAVTAHAQAANTTETSSVAAVMPQFTSTRTGNANMCPNLQYAFRGICVDLCPIGYVADNETRTCMKTAALNCTSGTYIHEGTCVATCPQGFVADNTTQSCLRNATDLLIGYANHDETESQSSTANEAQKDADMSENTAVADNSMTQTNAAAESQTESSDKLQSTDSSAQDDAAKRRLRFRI